MQGRVSAAAWSADCRHLVFATTDEPVLYCLSFGSGSEAAIPVLDLSLARLHEDSQLVGGGLVQDIQWDPSGESFLGPYILKKKFPGLRIRTRGNIQRGKLKQKRTGFLRNLDKHCALIVQFIKNSQENLFIKSSISSLNIASGRSPTFSAGSGNFSPDPYPSLAM